MPGGLALRLPAHRASSATLAGAYPFLVAPSCSIGVLVGTDALTGEPFCFDPWDLYSAGVLTNPNVLLAGVIGQGKSALAKTLAEGGNLILLDEPTNDLDIETLQNLEEALEDFAGCAVVISHDRWFLDRLATHILAFEGDSHVEWFEGNFEAYEEDKKRRLGADSLIPHRIKFHKFSR